MPIAYSQGARLVVWVAGDHGPDGVAPARRIRVEEGWLTLGAVGGETLRPILADAKTWHRLATVLGQLTLAVQDVLQVVAVAWEGWRPDCRPAVRQFPLVGRADAPRGTNSAF